MCKAVQLLNCFVLFFNQIILRFCTKISTRIKKRERQEKRKQKEKSSFVQFVNSEINCNCESCSLLNPFIFIGDLERIIYIYQDINFNKVTR